MKNTDFNPPEIEIQHSGGQIRDLTTGNVINPSPWGKIKETPELLDYVQGSTERK